MSPSIPGWRAARRAVLAAALLAMSATALAQNRLVPLLPDLTGVLNTEMSERKTALEWAIVLGKALFWDLQAGSDGVACASCHYNAGADIRIANQLSPGTHDLFVSPAGDRRFGSTRSDTGQVQRGRMPSGTVAAPNLGLTAADFPLHRLADEVDRNAQVVTTTNDMVSSQGAFAAPFTGVNATTGIETCGPASADLFHVGGIPARQVARRNSGTTINAIFNRRTLWDGAANNVFNGVGSFGMRDIAGDPNKRLVVLDGAGLPALGYLQLRNASLASQAVGPVVNAIEMSCAGRRLADVGRKLLAAGVRPLARQAVSATDGVLGALVDASGNGLAPAYGYAALVQRAFDPKYWSAAGRFSIADGRLAVAPGRGGYTQMEHNWSMFFGLSLLLYQSTLVSGTSEFDGLIVSGVLSVRDIRVGPPFDCTANGDVDPLLLRGCQIFFRDRNPTSDPPGAGCNSCHGGKDLFTSASFLPQQKNSPIVKLGTVLDNDITNNLFDVGFQNTGVRPTFTDPKVGGVDPYGKPLSYTRQYMNYLTALDAGRTPERALADHIHDLDLQLEIAAGNVFLQDGVTAAVGAKENVDGAAKTPTMRNVALTPPYMSSGMFATLRQVLKFYNRESNRRDITAAGEADAMGTACTDGDTSGSGTLGDQTLAALRQTPQACNTNVQISMLEMGLKDCERPGSGCDPETDDLAALIRFLRALSDPRVQCDQAPFDHPALDLTVGHAASDTNGDGRADDLVFRLPATGAAGYAPRSGLCIPNAGDLFAPGMQGRAGGSRVPLAGAAGRAAR